MPTRDQMAENTPYFGGTCTNCLEMTFGAGMELIFARWEDGTSDQHTACGKCVQLIKKHNDAIEKILADKESAEAPVKEAAVERQPSAKQPPAPAVDMLTTVLMQLAEGQKLLLNEIREMKHPTLPPPVEEKKTNGKPASRRK